ncbi:MAG TPA: helix-turn-helix domain-containing protein [Candidatus Acidoferrales bacterium]|nr:helix-turn-helix domain-containing protein [Candidatus Acidoferrales bacterium]
MAEITDQLVELGFSEYEARAYVALTKKSPLNGYELAREAGIPRANVYSVLERLELRRAVLRLESSAATRYAPVPAEELMHRIGANFTSLTTAVIRQLQTLGEAADFAQVWNARGYQALLDQARAAVSAAKRTLLIAIAPPEAALLRDELRSAADRGVAVTTLCVAACANECGGCAGQVFRYRVLPDEHVRWFLAVTDGAEVVCGEVKPDNEASLIRTRHELVVELASAYIRQSIALATITEDLGERFDDLVSSQTQAVLQSLGPAGSGGFLQYLHHLLGH